MREWTDYFGAHVKEPTEQVLLKLQEAVPGLVCAQKEALSFVLFYMGKLALDLEREQPEIKLEVTTCDSGKEKALLLDFEILIR